jgi:hypothetical protein
MSADRLPNNSGVKERKQLQQPGHEQIEFLKVLRGGVSTVRLK